MEKGENIPTPTQLPSDSENYNDHQEHTRQLLFEILKERGEILIRKQEKELMKDLILKLLGVFKMKKRKGKIKGHEIIFNGTAIIKSSKPMLMQVTHAQKWWVTRQ